MRVCLISSSFYPAVVYGGPISATWDLSRKLANKGVKVYVSTTNANGREKLKIISNRFIKKEENLFVKYYNEQIINKFSLSFLLGVWDDIRKSDVIYIQYLFHYTVLFSLFFSLLFKKKIIICPRGSLSSFTLENKRRLYKKIWLNLFISPFRNKIIWQASSSLEKEDILIRYPRSKVELVSDGIDFESFQEYDRIDMERMVEKYTSIAFKEVSEVIFSMGRLHKIKGYDVLIDAFSLYLKDNPNSKLLIAGDDNGIKNELEIQIQKLNLEDSVFLIGLVNFNQKKELLSNSDVFVLASEFESFGIVIAESLACGTPVIVSNKTLWKDIEKNNCGILADNEKNSFYDIFKKFKNLEFDSNVIKNYVKCNYDWERIVDSFIDLFKNKYKNK